MPNDEPAWNRGVPEALLRRPVYTGRPSRRLRGLMACVGRMNGPGSRASRVCVLKPELGNKWTRFPKQMTRCVAHLFLRVLLVLLFFEVESETNRVVGDTLY